MGPTITKSMLNQTTATAVKGRREYVLAFGPADPAYQHAAQISVHQCPECAALVVEDFMPEHERWHRDTDKRFIQR